LVPLDLAAQSAAAPSGALSAKFAKYTDYGPLVPVYVMPTKGSTTHRFFDTSPISPSGRYLALFQLPYERRSPRPGDAGEVVLIDLKSGEARGIAQSRGWGVQLGANVQWGRSDAELYFNDVDPRTWKAFAIQMNPLTGTRRELDGTVFMVSPDGASLVSHNLVKSSRVLAGYGVTIPDDCVGTNIGPVADDGVYVTDTRTGRARMLVSLKTIYENAVPSIRIPDAQRYQYYCFQAKWNSQGTRLLTTVDWIPLSRGVPGHAVITMKADGSQIRAAVTAEEWARGGHHICWCRDETHLSMNLVIDDHHTLGIRTFRFDGSDLRTVFAPGSGHPSFHPRGRYIITDAYPDEPIAYGDGTTPIRLIDTRLGTCTVIARVYVSATKGEFRVDPHPAWDFSGRYVVFNGLAAGNRKVYIADVGQLVK
jgi:hypothetical protein